MKIPNDNGKDYRLKKFVEYQHEVPPVHRAILLNYAKDKKLTSNDLIYLSWLMSNTYHEITALIMFEEVKYYENNFYEKFYNRYILNEKKIQFGSAKKYNAIQRRFLETIKYFQNNYGKEPYLYLIDKLSSIKDPKKRYEKIIELNKNCKNHGRFSADLFNEILLMYQEADMLKLNIKGSDTFDWNNCANLTSAVFNILYQDDLADKFDKGLMNKAEVKKYEKTLTNAVINIQKEIMLKYGTKIDTPLFVTKLCSFRNLFKNQRYGGFHHDRQLQYLLKYNKELPEKKELYKEILKYRSKNFVKELLGEKNNWKGVRTQRKKIWTKYGLTGVEKEAVNLLNL